MISFPQRVGPTFTDIFFLLKKKLPLTLLDNKLENRYKMTFISNLKFEAFRRIKFCRLFLCLALLSIMFMFSIMWPFGYAVIALLNVVKCHKVSIRGRKSIIINKL